MIVSKIYLQYFLTLVLFVAADSEDLHYSIDEQTLSNCIENSNFLKNINNFKGTVLAKTVAGFAAPRLISNVNTREIINHLDEIIHNMPATSHDDTSWASVQNAIMSALIHCSEDIIRKRCSEPNYYTSHRKNLPKFPDEPSDLANILDFILVDWPETLEVMISTREGRAVLRRYAEDAQRALEKALSYDGNTHLFRFLIRTFWPARAQMYFNFNNIECPYLFHYYTLDDRVPYTCGCANKHVNTRYSSFENPSVSRQDVDRILNIHRADRLDQGEFDVFVRYDSSGMTSDEYYLEIHIDQFFRILFFFQELRARNIWTDQDDDYEGAIPITRMPLNLQAIVYNDDIYRNYLLNLRNRLLAVMTDTNNVNRQNLLRTARPHEENLILLFSALLKNFERSVVTTTTTTTTTTVRPTSAKPDRKRKKENIGESSNEHGFKNKRFKSFPDSCCQIKNGKSVDKKYMKSCLKKQFNYPVENLNDKVFDVCSKVHTQSQNQKIESLNNYWGYVTGSENSDQLLYMSDESSFLIKTLPMTLFSV